MSFKVKLFPLTFPFCTEGGSLPARFYVSVYNAPTTCSITVRFHTGMPERMQFFHAARDCPRPAARTSSVFRPSFPLPVSVLCVRISKYRGVCCPLGQNPLCGGLAPGPAGLSPAAGEGLSRKRGSLRNFRRRQAAGTRSEKQQACPCGRLRPEQSDIRRCDSSGYKADTQTGHSDRR